MIFSTIRPTIRLLGSFTVATLLLTSGRALAFGIDTGNPDIDLRWDNTLRYDLGVRTDGRDSKIANTAITDEGTYSFDTGDIVTDRFDLLSELDFSWKGKVGARVSGAAWYDNAYKGKGHGNPNPPLSAIPSYVGNQYSNYTKRFYEGPSGELMDAFAFGNFSIGDVPVSMKAGRHALFWGESLLLNGAVHSVGYAQVPLDLQKAIATPGVEAKELFRPLNSISMQAQLTDTLSLAGQYFLQWESFRYPEGGTYLGPVDFLFNGPQRQYVSSGLGFATRGAAAEPKNSGEYGFAARWSPAALNSTLGFYYRRYADKMPQVFLTQVAPNASVYNNIYAGGISLYGISFSKQVLGTSIGAELSYRRDTPLNAQVLGVAPGLPQEGETKGPRGDTVHGLVNAFGVIGKTPLFDAATWITEATWNHYTTVRSGANLFNADGYAPCTSKGFHKWDGCATRDYFGLGVSFTPTWYQVFPNVDLLMPITVSDGLYGNSAVVLGGNQGNGNYTIGVGADLFQAYRIDLKYIDYFGHVNDNGTSVISQNGLTSLLKDRGYVALTLKATF